MVRKDAWNDFIFFLIYQGQIREWQDILKVIKENIPNFLILFSKLTYCCLFLLCSQTQSKAFSSFFYSLLLQNHGHQLQTTTLSIIIIACCHTNTNDLIVINLQFQLPGHIFVLRYLFSQAATKFAGRRDFISYLLI